MEQSSNQISLRGNIHSAPEFSHENHGRQFYRFQIHVPRLSGVSDSLPVIAEKTLLENAGLSQGDMVSISGQIRSHNIRTEGKRHLLLFVFAASIHCETGEAINQVMLSGPVCREPVYRRTPLGREICDIMLAVPRSFRRADYLPCILWGKTAREAAEYHVNQQIQITGRFQSRNYTKLTENGAEQRTAYEVSVLTSQILCADPFPTRKNP